MAKFKTQCPLCLAEIHVHSQWAGQQAVCPSCNETITIPAPPGEIPDMPHVTTCPACHATQSIPPDVTGRARRNCSKCGSSYLFCPDISFPCAQKLPPDRNGNPRIACPRCGRHYVLKYTPANGLIGCQECMTIFAHPDTEDESTSIKHRPVLQPPVIQPAPLQRPAAPAVRPFSNDSDIQFLQPSARTAPAETKSAPAIRAVSLPPQGMDEEEMVTLPHIPRENTQLEQSDSAVKQEPQKKSIFKKFLGN